MKTCRRILAGVLIIGASVGFYLNANQATEISDWSLANVEALATSETGGDSEGNKLICYSVIQDENYGRFTVTKCSSCMDVRCSDYSVSSQCKK